MKEAEKEAERIIEKYYLNPVLKRSEAIECAIIHVEGIIESSLRIFKIYKVGASEIKYWKEVLEIIKNK